MTSEVPKTTEVPMAGEAKDVTQQITAFVESIFRKAHFDLKATATKGSDEIRVQLSGRDDGLLLAHNAELMNALEYLVNRAFGRMISRDLRISLDSNNYRLERESELRMMAQKAAERVRISRNSFVFEPMSSSERRVVHLALVEDTTVRTESRGEGEDRKVVILPA